MRTFILCVFFWPLFAGIVGDEEVEERIINGFPAGPYLFPEMVSIHYKGEFKCAGLIYDKRSILAIASCFSDPEQEESRYVIKAGDLRLAIKDTTEQKIKVDEIITHPNFVGNRIFYDIAVLKLTRPLEFNEFVSKINIPDLWKEAFLTKRNTCMLGGWGYTEKEKMAWTLQAGTTRLMDRGSCREILDVKYDYNLSMRAFCTLTPGEGPCINDYGGAVTCFDSEGGKYHVGMIYGHDSDCSFGFGLHLRLPKFRNWLAGVTD